MPSLSTNADAVAAAFQAKIPALNAALDRGMKAALLAVETDAQKNLSGSGKPYSYPVPVRTGNLRRSMGVQQLSAVQGIVYNSAGYAWAVHSGTVNEWAGRGKTRQVDRTARPFLLDAANSADPGAIIVNAVVMAL